MIDSVNSTAPEFDEVGWFLLYWAQFFDRPITERGLTELARRNLHGVGVMTADTALQELKSCGALREVSTANQKSPAVVFVREHFSVDEMRAILEACEKYAWRVKSGYLTSTWMWSACMLNRKIWYDNAEYCLERAVLRHAILRWGIRALEIVQSEINNARYSWRPDKLDVADDANWSRIVTGALPSYIGKREVVHSGPLGIMEIGEFPQTIDPTLKERYETGCTRHYSSTDTCLLRKIALGEAEALRSGKSMVDPETDAELVAHLAADDFLEGRPTDWALRRFDELKSTAPISPRATLLMAALAFWLGDWATLEAMEQWSPYVLGHKHTVLNALRLADGGDFAAGGKEFAAAISIGYLPQNETWGYVDIPALLILLVCKVKAHDTAPFMKKFARILGSVGEGIDHLSTNQYHYVESPIAKNLMWATLIVNHALEESACRYPLSDPPTMMPFEYVAMMYAASYGAGNDDEHYSRYVEWAEVAARSGYRRIAADIVAYARIMPGYVAQSQELKRRFDAVPVGADDIFAAPKDTGEHWQQVIKSLVAALPKANSNDNGSKAERPVRRLRWCISCYCGKNARPMVVGAFPVVHKLCKNGDWSDPLVVAERAFVDGKLDYCMTADDKRIRSELIACGILEDGDYYDGDCMVSLRALRLLSERDDLLAVYSHNSYFDYPYAGGISAQPVKLTIETAKLQIRYRMEGGVEISAFPSAFEFDDRDEYAIRPIGADRSVLAVVSITDEYRKAVNALARITPYSSLTIPDSAVPVLEKALGGVSATAPISWAQAGELADHLQHVPTLVRPVVRLDYVESTLFASIAIRLSDEPDWSSEPATGPVERIVVDKDGSRRLLVRDFVAENEAVKPIRKLLKGRESARTGDNYWVFNRIEDALDILSVLHGASKEGGFELEWPNGKRLDVASVVANSSHIEGGETVDYWLSVSGEFKLDDGEVLSFIDLLRNFNQRTGSYVRMTDNRYLKLSAAMARRIEALNDAGIERHGKLIISPAALPSLEKTARETAADDQLPLPKLIAERIDRIRKAFSSPQRKPREFRCEMRPYQIDGYKWLARLYDCRIGACLADDMGLGKTIQLIALLLARRSEGPSLVVAPASVCFNWRNEIGRFAPSLACCLVGQTPGDGDVDVVELAGRYDVVIASYGVVASREERFQKVDWNIVVLDEAQAIKNHNTMRSRCVKTLRAKFRIAATGTPIENRLTELWSIFDFLNPGMLGGETYFNRELAPHGEATPRLKRLVKPLVLRRIKREVLSDLPEKEEITLPVVLGNTERTAYEATRVNALAKLKSGDANDKLAILAELTRLRRFCCHPSLVMPSVAVSAKLETLTQLLADLHDNNHRALVFSQFVDYLSIVRKCVEKSGWTYQYLDGSTSKRERERAVSEFQSGNGDFFLISLKAGGTGLNLTAANYVILLDPWWNPAVENQAADRAHRIGQRLPVTVYRLIAKDTIEEKVVNLHTKKLALAEDVLATGASALTPKELLDLMS